MSDERPKQVITVQAEIIVPEPPNFFKITDGQMLPIEAVPNKDLDKIASLYAIALIKKAEKKRQINKNNPFLDNSP